MSNFIRDNVSIPKALVEKMLDTTTRQALSKGHRDERMELICRLLASGMSVDEISLVLKIRKEDIIVIEEANERTIFKYTQTLKNRRTKRRE